MATVAQVKVKPKTKEVEYRLSRTGPWTPFGEGDWHNLGDVEGCIAWKNGRCILRRRNGSGNQLKPENLSRGIHTVGLMGVRKA